MPSLSLVMRGFGGGCKIKTVPIYVLLPPHPLPERGGEKRCFEPSPEGINNSITTGH
jgi:hypothetical protein